MGLYMNLIMVVLWCICYSAADMAKKPLLATAAQVAAWFHVVVVVWELVRI